MRFAFSLVLSLLLMMVGAVPAFADAHEGAISVTYPVDGAASYTDDFDQCRGSDCSRRHLATDLMAAYGTPVHAAQDGEVTWITGLDGNPPSYGYMLNIRGDDGRTYGYVHLGRQDGPPSEAYAEGLREGSRVERGEHIGYVGHSGNASSDAPHLHFSIRDPNVTDPYGSNYRNPYASLRDAQERGDLPGTTQQGASPGGPVPLAGDWNGNGHAAPGWFDEGVFRLCLDDDDGTCTARQFRFGKPGDVPVVGDWNGDGSDTVGIVRAGTWHLRDELSGGRADRSFVYGRVGNGDFALVGDWNGDGIDTVGIVRDGTWHLRNDQSGGRSDVSFVYGKVTQGDVPITGDWDGDGIEGVGVVRDGIWHLRDEHAGGAADSSVRYGRASGDAPVVGDWASSGVTGLGVVRDGSWYLRSAPTGGSGDQSRDWPS